MSSWGEFPAPLWLFALPWGQRGESKCGGEEAGCEEE